MKTKIVRMPSPATHFFHNLRCMQIVARSLDSILPSKLHNNWKGCQTVDMVRVTYSLHSVFRGTISSLQRKQDKVILGRSRYGS